MTIIKISAQWEHDESSVIYDTLKIHFEWMTLQNLQDGVLPGAVGEERAEEGVLNSWVYLRHNLIQGAEVFTDQVKDAGRQSPHL